ncbi:MAG: SNF2-related protein [Myxococcota bacterium]
MKGATLPPIEPAPSANLVATWTGREVFLWSRTGAVDDALAELPGIPPDRVAHRIHPVALARTRTLRATAAGIDVRVVDALPALSGLPTDVPVSDSVRCLSLCAKFALELAAARRVVPTVDAEGCARWIAVVARPEDRFRFEALVQAVPEVTRSAGEEERPSTRTPLTPARRVVRTFLDAVVDQILRTSTYPGPARGWALDYARALCGEDARFTVRDARAQATPDRIAAWAARGEAPLPRIAFALELPREGEERFPLRVLVHRPGDPTANAPVAEAWRAGRSVTLGGEELFHPAEAVLRGLARAARLHPPLQRGLPGGEPADPQLDAAVAWALLDVGRAELEAAGFAVLLPPAFERAGRQRIRTRIRLTLTGAGLDLAQALTYRWEVLVGDQVLGGKTFARLCAERRPIVRYQGEWVFLDPAELARLPRDLSKPGEMSAPEALQAVLTGEYRGVPVVADERLSVVLQALREPPDLPPPDGLRATLRPYQARGYAWLCALGALGLGALLADDMGLGKTVQLIAYLLARREGSKERRASLVVCPTSVLGNWQRELRRFAPDLAVGRWHGLDRDEIELEGCDVVLTTYGLLVRDIERLGAAHWDAVVLDEAQAIKNPDSRRARCARRLHARHRVALTGTPVENRLDELWSVVEFLVPGLLGPRATFQRQIAVPIERFGDEDAALVLRRTVSPFLLRRSKTDPNVADDLPDKVERRQGCDLTEEQRRLYQSEVDAAMAEIAGSGDLERRGRVLAMLTALKQICNHPYQFLRRREEGADPTLPGRSGKLDRITELVEDIVGCGERVVMFTQYREMGDLLQQHLQNVLQEPVPFLHGGTPALARDEMVRRFQEDDRASPVLLVSLKAGGTGLSLTRANHVIHYDRWWNPAVEDQATDRAHRIGQKQTVLVHKVVCEGTLEERIDAVLDEKRELFDTVVGSGERWVTELDDDALLQLVLLSPSGE